MCGPSISLNVCTCIVWVSRSDNVGRSSQYESIEETTSKKASTNSQTQGSQQGKRVVLPSSFFGSRRFMDQLYFDGMTIFSYMGFQIFV